MKQEALDATVRQLLTGKPKARFSGALKGIGGEYELNRLVGAIGGFVYIFGAIGFVAWDVLHKGKPFDLTEFCIAFPGGLAVVVGAVAGAVSVKDRNVAAAKVISETGAVPVAPPAGPPVPTEKVE